MKKIAVLVLLIFAAVFAVGCSGTQEPETVGEVNGIKISKAEYEQRYQLLQASYKMQQAAYTGDATQTEGIEIPEDTLKQLQDRAFEDMVYQKLLFTDAKDRGIEVSKEEVDQAVAEFKELQTQAGEYDNFLKLTGLTEETLWKEMEMDQYITKLQAEITADVKVTDEDARAYYDENKDLYKVPAGIQISHILVDSEEKAVQLIADIKAGADFATAAKENSTDTVSAANGGDLGIVNEEMGFVQEFQDAAFKLEPGQMTDTPVKTEFGYHIIKAGERQEESIPGFEEVQNNILLSLQQEKETTVFNDYIEDLYNKADIKDNRK